LDGSAGCTSDEQTAPISDPAPIPGQTALFDTLNEATDGHVF
jgi:hypothetical protein